PLLHDVNASGECTGWAAARALRFPSAARHWRNQLGRSAHPGLAATGGTQLLALLRAFIRLFRALAFDRWPCWEDRAQISSESRGGGSTVRCGCAAAAPLR